jgi:hypothetical protein
LCRKCRIFLGEDQFNLVPERAGELKHSFYCGACFDQHVEPFKAEYDATFERAKGINVLYRNSKSLHNTLRKAEKALKVENSPDRDEAIFALAFQAAEGGFNAIMDVEVSSQKLRNAGWQKTSWSARGVPAEIKSYELDR